MKPLASLLFHSVYYPSQLHAPRLFEGCYDLFRSYSSLWLNSLRKRDALFLRLCIMTLASSKAHLSLTLFMNHLPLLCSSSSTFTSFIFISVVQSMFFWACILTFRPGPKLSFLNLLALSTRFCASFFFGGNSMSHHCLILFIKFVFVCLSSLFICTNFNICSFIHHCSWYEHCCYVTY